MSIPPRRDSVVNMSQATLKQRVNMVVMRMIAQNSDHDQKQGQPQGQQQARGRGGQAAVQPVQAPSAPNATLHWVRRAPLEASSPLGPVWPLWPEPALS